jgi:Flp pilus assembly protein protease CpaA
MTWLLIYIFVVSLYDWRTQRIPNWCTIPLIIAGMITHFPGHIDLWLACFVLVSAWSAGWMGAGDAKLWMALLWSLPNIFMPSLILLMFTAFSLTGISQMLWRIIKKLPIHGSKSPAAWRTIPFFLMVWYVH